MELEILSSTNEKQILQFKNVAAKNTVRELKERIHSEKPHLYLDRQEIRLAKRGKGLDEKKTLEELGILSGTKLFLKDLGPQVGYRTVFLAEYAGPLFIYLIFYMRPSLIYNAELAAKFPVTTTMNIAAGCWCGHYLKRLWESVFVHRFSHATMPIKNLFRNCSYYWGFAAYVAYYVNHPLFTSPAMSQVMLFLGTFLFCELGNLSIHMALRDLRPPGTKVRKIPQPTLNPFTLLFNYVSCPNYTYEFGAWLSFSLMTQCFPALLFTAAGMYQMTQWALGKQRAYKKDFPNYPRGRTSILPFIL